MKRLTAHAVAMATVLLAAGRLGPDGPAARGAIDDPPGSAAAPEASAPVSQTDFLAEVYRTLKTQRERMIALAKRSSKAEAAASSLGDQLMTQRITVEYARAVYNNATLTREVAELAIVEYETGVFPQDEATLKGELALAQSDVGRKKSVVDVMNQMLANAARASNGSASDLAVIFDFKDRVAKLEREERKARLDVEKAKTKLEVLVRFTKPIQILELKSEVARARTDELAKKAALEIEIAKVRWLHEEVNAARGGNAETPAGSSRRPGERGRSQAAGPVDRIPILLERAVAVEEQIRARLGQIKSGGKLEPALQQEIRASLAQLNAIVDQAEAERSAGDLERVKAMLRQAAHALAPRHQERSRKAD